MKIAVVGSGPASAGTCLGLLSKNNTDEVYVFDIGRRLGNGSTDITIPPSEWKQEKYLEIHKNLEKKNKGWVPEKSFFGDYPRKYYPSQSILKSDILGGLSKFWGSSFLPFNENDFAEWPISYSDIQPFYEKLLQEIKITGANDQLGNYFSNEFINDDPVRTPQTIKKLGRIVSSDIKSYGFIAGNPRLALINSGENACTYCGHCFYGCYNQSIYSADMTINRLAKDGKIKYVSGQQVISFNKQNSGIIELLIHDLSNGNNDKRFFDKVYIAAGCIETTRIVANSFGLINDPFPVFENPMFQIPLVYMGRVPTNDFKNILALNNLIIGRLPGNGIDEYVHMQVYPLNVYLWNHALIKGFGSSGIHLSKLFQNTLGKHVYMMLFYLHGKYTGGSTISFNGEDQDFQFHNQTEANSQAKRMIQQLSDTIKGSGFKLLPQFMAPLASGGSYHYAGTIPMNKNKFSLNSSCSIIDNVYLVDSSTFPSLPAQNHSFTIMANAYRVGSQSII